MAEEELADGVRTFLDPTGARAGIVVGAAGALCVDAVPEGAGEPLRFLFLTHRHAHDLGATVLAHAAAAARPTVSFAGEVRVSLGDRDVVLGGVGRGHSAGDAVAWLPEERVLFAGELVVVGAAPAAAEAHLAEWRSATLARVASFRAETLVPRRGPVVRGPAVTAAIDRTRAHLDALCLSVARTVAGGGGRDAAVERAAADLAPRFGDTAGFADLLPGNVARAWDELQGRAPAPIS